MTKIAFLDCPTGISGDMCLGALIHAGVPLAYLTEQLAALGISQEYRLWSELVHRNGQQATKAHVDLLTLVSQPVSQPTSLPPATVSEVNVPGQAHSAEQHDSGHPEQSSSEHSHVHSSHHHSHSHHHHAIHSPIEHSPIEHSHAAQSHAVHHHAPEVVHNHAGTRHLPEIEQIILAAPLPRRVQQWSLAIFRRLAAAEGAVHGISPEQVHFHEVGATDAIVDIVGTCIGLDYLGVDALYCSALPVGGGTVWAAHGRLPVPPPAVLKLFELGQVSLYSNGIQRELVTPTGAAIATTLASGFGAPPPLRLHKVGLGAGSHDLPIPNILRLWIGESDSQGSTRQHSATASLSAAQTLEHPVANTSQTANGLTAMGQSETVAVLETQIDDLNPQAIGYTMSTLLSAGALDVFTQAIGMKKSRPGVLLTVICRPEQVPACEAILFRETTTLGIRHSSQQRTVLQRTIESVTTPYGIVGIKIARHPQGAIVNVQPEFEDCAQLAQQQNLPWREVQRVALQSWYTNQQRPEDPIASCPQPE